MPLRCSKPFNVFLLHLEQASQAPHHGWQNPTWPGPGLFFDLLSPSFPWSLGSSNTASLLFLNLPRPALS